MPNNTPFAAFILSHGRSDRVITYHTLRSRGYTGPIIIVLDDTDKEISNYQSKFEDVVIFNKQDIALKTDNGDNFRNYRSTTHPRNAIFEIAAARGIESFIMLDDDYVDFRYKFLDNKYGDWLIHKDLDRIFKAFTEFHASCPPSVKSIAFAQGGDFIGGKNGSNACRITLLRKCMNSFFCRTDRPFMFFSRLNEDVNTYLVLGQRGALFFTSTQFALQQMETQTNKGGMSDAYIDSGTYVKSAYSVMYRPDCTRIRPMGPVNPRLHHAIRWRHAVPKILRPQC